MPITAAIIGGGASILGGIFGSNASNSAANKVATADQQAASSLGNLGQVQFDSQGQALQPYLFAGQQGVNAFTQAIAPGGDLAKQFSFDPAKIAENPNYQFVLQQGTKAVQQSAAAQGGLFSGGTLKALDQYSQGLATQTVNDAYAQAAGTFQMNHNNMFQNLTTATQIGQNANNQEQANMALRANLFEAAANAQMGVGAAQAQGTLGSAAAWTNALNGVAGNAQNYFNSLSGTPPGGYNPTTGTVGAGPTSQAGIDAQIAAGW